EPHAVNQHSSKCEALISRTKDFGNTYELIQSKLSSLRERLAAADGLQPDILAKKSQSDQFRVRSHKNCCPGLHQSKL
uniref:Uncharacterized protein n=1 Tax=Acanthochromis polyacanthus TaxID=80966 RepID=A0A3Q1G2L9_9TELE